MADNSIDYLNVMTEVFRLDRLIMLVLGGVIVYVLSKAIQSFSLKLSIKAPNKKNKILQISTLINFFVSLAGSGSIIYFTLNPSREVTIAFLGSASVAIGFSLKDLVSSLISGITIITDPPFKVGDFVQYKEIKGHVTHVGLRVVRILNADHQVITIPNSNITSDFVIVQNPGDGFIQTVTSFYLPISVDIEKVKNILYEVACTGVHIYLSEKVLITIEQVLNPDMSYLKFNVKAHVSHSQYSDDFQADLYHRSFKVFKEKKIIMSELK